MFAVAETVYGTTPATPALKTIRNTGTTLALTKGSYASDELRADRQIVDFRHSTRGVAGDINGELSAAAFDDFIEAALGGTWTANVLKAGITRRSFSILRNFSDIASADKPYHLFTGCEVNNFKLQFSAGDAPKATVGFGMVGKDLVIGTAAPTGATYPAAPTGSVMDCLTGTIQEGGAALGIITEVNITLENGVSPRPVVGSATTILPSIGRSNLTGQVTAYFENSTLLEKFINETASSLLFTLSNGGKSYEFNIPNIKYTGGQPDTSGQGPITLAMPFQAIYDSTSASQVIVMRVP